MCRGTEQFSEMELIIPVVNNASHVADAVPSAHSWALQIPLVCRQVGKEREVILNNISCDTWQLRILWHCFKALHQFQSNPIQAFMYKNVLICSHASMLCV